MPTEVTNDGGIEGQEEGEEEKCQKGGYSHRTLPRYASTLRSNNTYQDA